MIGSRSRHGIVRHIPEDELHAYLDQALSRSQCVEIESHLAECPSCQATRDAIAALRDRTTALLARLAPPTRPAPGFELIRRRAAAEASNRRRRVHLVAWAASLLVALGAGWSAASLVERRPPIATPTPMRTATQVQIAESARTAPAVRTVARPAQRPPVSRPAAASTTRKGASAVAPAARTHPARRITTARNNEVPLLKVSPPELSALEVPKADRELELDGVWRTMSWDGAQAEAGDEKLPHIDGLPVVQVQVQTGEQGKRPLMVVAQQLASGEVIRTIEGPATDVSRLLGRRSMTDPDPTLAIDSGSGSADQTRQAMAMQRGDRMLAITGALPSDSLRAMIRRLNAEMRK